MSGLKRLIHEIHRRSLWQVLLIYIAASWAVLEAADVMVSRLSLPEWVYGAAIVLLLVGLPIVLATAFVQEGLSAATRQDPTLLAGAEPESEARPREVGGARRLFTWRNAISGGVLALALWGVVATGWYVVYGGGEPVTRSAAVERPSVAVLLFENRSGLEQDEYFTDGLHDEILTQLSKIGGLSVRGRTSVMQYRNVPKNLRQIGEELNARYLLEGGVLRAGETVRINVQLIDAGGDENLWAETYDRQLSVENLLAVQAEIALRVSGALEAAVTPAEKEQIERKPTDNLEAYEYYLRGNAHKARHETEDEAEMYERAVELDSEFAVAWAALSESRLWLFFERFRMDMRPKAEEALDRAIALAPNSFETRVAQGRFHLATRGYDRARQQLAIAERLRPNDPAILGLLGWSLTFGGQWEEGLAYWKRALALDPRHSFTALIMGSVLRRMRRFAEAERSYDRAIALAPSSEANYDEQFYLYLYGFGDTVRARAFAEQHAESVDRDLSSRWLALLDYYRRDYQTALDARLKLALEGQEAEHNRRQIAYLYHAMDQSQLRRAYGDSLRFVADTALATLMDAEALEVQLALRHSQLGLAYALMDEEEAAIREGKQAVEMYPVSVDAWNGDYLVENLATIYLLIGHHDAAIEQLEFLLSVPSRMTAARLRLDPIWDPLRDHPRFQALLEREQ